MELLFKSLQSWNKSTHERAKLQHVYVAIIIIVTVIAGLLSLVNYTLGQQLMIVTGLALIAFLMNALVWALTRVYLIDYLERKQPARKTR